MTNFNSKEFLKLKASWYKKLAKSGFVDAENDKDELIQGAVPYAYRNRTLYGIPSTEVVAEFHETGINATREYFDLAIEFLKVHTFKDAKEKEIWAIHADGLTAKAVVKKHPRKRGYKKANVSRIIKELRDIMLKLEWRKASNE